MSSWADVSARMQSLTASTCQDHVLPPVFASRCDNEYEQPESNSCIEVCMVSNQDYAWDLPCYHGVMRASQVYLAEHIDVQIFLRILRRNSSKESGNTILMYENSFDNPLIPESRLQENMEGPANGIDTDAALAQELAEISAQAQKTAASNTALIQQLQNQLLHCQSLAIQIKQAQWAGLDLREQGHMLPHMSHL